VPIPLQPPNGVEIGEPLLSGGAAADAFRDFCVERKRVLEEFGVEWDKRAQQEARYHFDLSPQMLGPLTAKAFAGHCLRNLVIQTKHQGNIPFLFNSGQYQLAEELLDKAYLQGKPVRACILKARQFGFSTMIQALAFTLSSSQSAFNTTTLAQKGEATSNLYAMSLRYYDRLKFKPRTNKRNRRRISFPEPIDSEMRCESAEVKEAGRSMTNRFVHASEVAFWPFAQETRLGVAQTVAASPGTFFLDESTANGMGGEFYDLYTKAKSDTWGHTKALFYPWHKHAEYTSVTTGEIERALHNTLSDDERTLIRQYGVTYGQLLWRRQTIADKCGGSVDRFKQEYPADDMEAFLTSGTPVFDPRLIQARLVRATTQVPVFEGHILRDF
jgi:hypothetical protein